MPSIFNSSTSLITSGLVDKECCFTSLVLFDFQSPQSLNLKKSQQTKKIKIKKKNPTLLILLHLHQQAHIHYRNQQNYNKKLKNKKKCHIASKSPAGPSKCDLIQLKYRSVWDAEH